MTNEATIIVLLGNGGDPVEFTCADNTTIEKGTLLELTDPMTVKKISAVDKPFAGIAAAEKVADDGATTISVYTNGIFGLTTGSGKAAVLGNDVVSNGSDNTVDTYDTLDDEKGYAIGKSLETVGASEVFACRVLK